MKESIKDRKGGASGMKRQQLVRMGSGGVGQDFVIFENEGLWGSL